MSLYVTIPDTFNGPLGLLHSLILRDEIDIYDIPIAKLLASYLEEISRLDMVNVDEGAEFLDLASRLMEIKLRLLVPPEEGEEGEEGEEDNFDPRSGLVAALLEYRRFKDAARLLGELAEEQSRRFPRVSPRMEFRIVDPDYGSNGDMDYNDLSAAFESLLAQLLSNDQFAPEVVETQEIPISTRMEQIEMVLQEKGRMRFSFLLSGIPDRFEMLGLFIAMLELMRQGKLMARQTDGFSDIILEKREPSAKPTDTAEGRVVPFPAWRVSRCFPWAGRWAGRHLPTAAAGWQGGLFAKIPAETSCPGQRIPALKPLFALTGGKSGASPAAGGKVKPGPAAVFPRAFSLLTQRGMP